jgi:hypothetical protein
VGAIRTYQDGVNLSDALSFEKNGQATFTERVKIEADSTATTQTTAVIQAIGTNSGIAIVPNGTGAITAAIPDGTVVGGNARGTNAVDLQSSRAINTEVASGNFAVIGGGQNNRVPNGYSSILGGFQNIVTGFYSSILGGENNTVSADRAVAMGLSNTSSGLYSAAIGATNTSSNRSSIALGEGNVASAIYSVALGRQSNAYLRGQISLSSAPFAAIGDSQWSNLIARKFDDLTTGGTTVLSLDGTGTTNLIIPQGNNRVWNVLVKTVAVVIGTSGTTTGVTVGDTFLQNQSILFKKIGGISSVVDLATDNTFSDGGMSTANMAYTAGASQELALTFTAPTYAGGGSVSLRIVSKVELVEAAYG